MRKSVTALELARQIADAVVHAAPQGRQRDSSKDPPTQAVIDTLHEMQCWFCRAKDQRMADPPKGKKRSPIAFEARYRV